MYYTGSGSIRRAGMDGSNTTTLVTDLSLPYGITIDFKSSRLFWAEFYANKIKSSDFQGGDQRTVAILPSKSEPTGVAVAGDKIYWGEFRTGKLQYSTIDGTNLMTLPADTFGDSIFGVTLVPALNRPQNRTNHCARHNCTRVCVLTPTSSRCLTSAAAILALKSSAKNGKDDNSETGVA